MSTSQRERSRTGRAWLFALPVLCCGGPVLIAFGAGSLAGLVGSTTGRTPLTAVGGVVLLAAVGVVIVHRRSTR